MGYLTQDHRLPKRYLTPVGAALLGLALGFMGVVIAQNLVGIWPSEVPGALRVVISDSVPDASGISAQALDSLERRVAGAALDSLRRASAAETASFWLGFRVADATPITWDFRLLGIALFMGALGSWLHGAASFVRFVGNRQLVSSWVPWYLMRPFVGGGMAVVFYAAVRAGFMTSAGSLDDGVAHYGVAAFAALVGLFTDKASKKLSEVFGVLFASREDMRDADRIERDGATGVPRIDGVKPDWIKIGTTPVQVTVTGAEFSDEPVVKLDGSPVDATIETDGKLVFDLDASLRARKGSIEVVVETAAGASEPKRITVTP